MTRDELKLAVAAFAGWLLIRLLALTWRIRVVNVELLHEAHRTTGPVIFALWHGQLLPLLYAHRGQNIAAMISEHRDGELIAQVAHHLGVHTVRGSTSRGAARALISACRAVEQGEDLAITVDGPRGPARSVAPGTMVVSQRTGAPVIPVVADASRAWRLKSWDRFMIPKPFARVTVAYDRPFAIAAATARDAIGESDAVRAALERAEQTAREFLAR
jgi:lysophospholipid acyltransferase (LPLAT)-like uncharacterized protein